MARRNHVPVLTAFPIPWIGNLGGVTYQRVLVGHGLVVVPSGIEFSGSEARCSPSEQ